MWWRFQCSRFLVRCDRRKTVTIYITMHGKMFGSHHRTHDHRSRAHLEYVESKTPPFTSMHPLTWNIITTIFLLLGSLLRGVRKCSTMSAWDTLGCASNKQGSGMTFAVAAMRRLQVHLGYASPVSLGGDWWLFLGASVLYRASLILGKCHRC